MFHWTCVWVSRLLMGLFSLLLLSLSMDKSHFTTCAKIVISFHHPGNYSIQMIRNQETLIGIFIQFPGYFSMYMPCPGFSPLLTNWVCAVFTDIYMAGAETSHIATVDRSLTFNDLHLMKIGKTPHKVVHNSYCVALQWFQSKCLIGLLLFNIFVITVTHDSWS